MKWHEVLGVWKCYDKRFTSYKYSLYEIHRIGKATYQLRQTGVYPHKHYSTLEAAKLAAELIGGG